MNYLLQLVEFRKRKLLRHLTTNAILLYYILLEYSNEIGFPDNFTAANSTLQGKSSLSQQKIQQARSQFADNGYITCSLGMGLRCGTYSLPDLTVSYDTPGDTPSGNPDGNPSGNPDGNPDGNISDIQLATKVITLTKQDRNKTKPNKKDTLPEKESMPDFEDFRKAYPKKQAKSDAPKAFLKLSPDRELPDRMIDAVVLFYFGFVTVSGISLFRTGFFRFVCLRFGFILSYLQYCSAG